MKRAAWVLGLAAVALISLVLARPNPQSGVVLSTEPIINYSSDQPDESKANAENYSWRGSATEPKRIAIPKIGVSAFIQKAGVDQNKQVAVPNNVHLAGWFNESVAPGLPGLAIIAGHVSGVTSPGIFTDLAKLKKDDTFTIEQGNGTILTYRVSDTYEVEEAKAASYLFSQSLDVESQLNLITCGGSFNAATNKYPNRIIITSELL